MQHSSRHIINAGVAIPVSLSAFCGPDQFDYTFVDSVTATLVVLNSMWALFNDVTVDSSGMMRSSCCPPPVLLPPVLLPPVLLPPVLLPPLPTQQPSLWQLVVSVHVRRA